MPAAFAVALAALAQEPVDLRWNPKSGEKLSYEYKLEAGGPQPSRLTAYLDVTVSQKGPEGYITRTVSRGALLTSMGSELKDTRQNPVTARFGLRGELLEIIEGIRDKGAYDLGRLTRFVAPPNAVKPGDSWVFDYPAEGEASAAKWSAKYEGPASGSPRPRARVTVTLVEAKPGKNPFTAKGEWEVDLATGAPEKLKAEFSHLGGSAATEGIRLNLTRMTAQDR